MSKFRYTPEGAQPQEWPYVWSKMMSPECIAIERATGMDYVSEFVPAVGRGNMTALTALLWIFLRRDEPKLTFDQVQFCVDDLEILPDDEQPATAEGGDQPGKGKARAR